MLDTEAVIAISSALRDELDLPNPRFDRLFPRAQRFRSAFHWTPIEVAVRACALLAPEPDLRVLDVGSGVGKLCLVGAVRTRASWVGIERDATMIRTARAAAHQLRVEDRVRFICRDAMTLDWSPFDSIYLFNPFAEVLLGATDDGAQQREQFARNVEATQLRLASLRSGARVVTYHGFGGEMPAGFELVHQEQALDDRLCVWVRL